MLEDADRYAGNSELFKFTWRNQSIRIFGLCASMQAQSAAAGILSARPPESQASIQAQPSDGGNHECPCCERAGHPVLNTEATDPGSRASSF